MNLAIRVHSLLIAKILIICPFSKTLTNIYPNLTLLETLSQLYDTKYGDNTEKLSYLCKQKNKT